MGPTATPPQPTHFGVPAEIAWRRFLVAAALITLVVTGWLAYQDNHSETLWPVMPTLLLVGAIAAWSRTPAIVAMALLPIFIGIRFGGPDDIDVGEPIGVIADAALLTPLFAAVLWFGALAALGRLRQAAWGALSALVVITAVGALSLGY